MRRQVELAPGFGDLRPQAGICGHPAGEEHLPGAIALRRRGRVADEGIDHSLLVAGCEVGEAFLIARGALRLDLPHEGGLEAAEAEVEAPGDRGPGESDCARVAGLRGGVERRASGVGQSEHAGSFVEGFAGGIIARPAEDLVFAKVCHQQDVAVSAGGHEADQRKLGLDRLGVAPLEEVREEMALQVVDPGQRQPAREGISFGGADADEQRPNEAGTVRDGDAVDVVPAGVGFPERLIDDSGDRLGVFARRNLRHDAAEPRVDGLLAGDNRR